MSEEVARLQHHIGILQGQIEKVAGELDKFRTQSKSSGGQMRMDGSPQFFNPKTMQPDVFKGGPRDQFVPWAGRCAITLMRTYTV